MVKNIHIISLKFFLIIAAATASDRISLEDNIPAKSYSQKKNKPLSENYPTQENWYDLASSSVSCAASRATQPFVHMYDTYAPTEHWKQQVLLLSAGIFIYSLNAYIYPTTEFSQIDNIDVIGCVAAWCIMEVIQNVLGGAKEWYAKSYSNAKFPINNKHRKNDLENRRRIHTNDINGKIAHLFLALTDCVVGTSLFYSISQQTYFLEDKDFSYFYVLAGVGGLTLYGGTHGFKELFYSFRKNTSTSPRNWEYLLSSAGLLSLSFYKTHFDHSNTIAYSYRCIDAGVWALGSEYLQNIENPDFLSLYPNFFDYFTSDYGNYKSNIDLQKCLENHYLKMNDQASIYRMIGAGSFFAYLRPVIYDIWQKTEKALAGRRNQEIVVIERDGLRIKSPQTNTTFSNNRDAMKTIAAHIQNTYDDNRSPPIYITTSTSSTKREVLDDAQRKMQREREKAQRKEGREKREVLEPLQGDVTRKVSTIDAFNNASVKPPLTEKQERKLAKINTMLEEMKEKTNITQEEFNAFINLATHFGLTTDGKKKSGNQVYKINGTPVDGLHPAHGTNRVERGRMSALWALRDAILAEYG
ncbi:MAG: hypothetical protein K2X98_03090, partial [Alphaproteobacteria bacterium]|nr:hypothetical protein [Alphaproteobacteria bacterium]